MARQKGNNFILANINHIVYYQLNGGYYLRAKSTLTRKRFQKDPAFAASRKRAAQFAEAVKLAKEIYYQLPKSIRQRGFIGILTGQVHQKLLAGLNRERVIEDVMAVYRVAPATIGKREDKAGSCLTAFIVSNAGPLQERPDATKHNTALSKLYKAVSVNTICTFSLDPPGRYKG